MEYELEKEVSELLEASTELKGAEIVSIIQLAGDASGRRFYRVTLKNTPLYDSAILLLSYSFPGPLAHATKETTPNDRFARLPALLTEVNLPKVFAYNRTKLTFLIEDVGDVALQNFIFNKQSPDCLAVQESLGNDYLKKLYLLALDELLKLQNIPYEESEYLSAKSFEFEEYKTEAYRFIDHYLIPNNYLSDKLPQIKADIDLLCEHISKHPRSLVHRDFMPWNIHYKLQKNGEVKTYLIDYQDILIGSRFYDIVSLLHDRDTDFTVDKALLNEVRELFKSKSNLPDFETCYYEVMLQRHLRLAGQFKLLAEKLGKPIYKNWVPGSLKRVGIALKKLPYLDKLVTLLTTIPEIKCGYDEEN